MRVPRRLTPTIGVVGLAIAVLASGGLAQSASTSPAPSGVPGASASPPPSPSPSLAPGVTQEQLATAFPVGLSHTWLGMTRTTLEPGASLADIHAPGTSISWVQSGSVTVDNEAGHVYVARNETDGYWLSVGRGTTVLTTQSVKSGPDATMIWTNDEAVPAVIITTAILDTKPPVIEPSPTPRPTAAPDFGGPVVKTVVVTGIGPAGQPSRITVRDHSGRLLGARIPSERELRFWSPLDGDGAGPLAGIAPRTHELMLEWSGSGCGPIVTIDVAADLRSMRLVDRTPGCDASAMGHWLVLRLRLDDWFDPTTIAITHVRRVPR